MCHLVAIERLSPRCHRHVSNKYRSFVVDCRRGDTQRLRGRLHDATRTDGVFGRRWQIRRRRRRLMVEAGGESAPSFACHSLATSAFVKATVVPVPRNPITWHLREPAALYTDAFNVAPTFASTTRRRVADLSQSVALSRNRRTSHYGHLGNTVTLQ